MGATAAPPSPLPLGSGGGAQDALQVGRPPGGPAAGPCGLAGGARQPPARPGCVCQHLASRFTQTPLLPERHRHVGASRRLIKAGCSGRDWGPASCGGRPSPVRAFVTGEEAELQPLPRALHGSLCTWHLGTVPPCSHLSWLLPPSSGVSSAFQLWLEAVGPSAWPSGRRGAWGSPFRDGETEVHGQPAHGQLTQAHPS